MKRSPRVATLAAVALLALSSTIAACVDFFLAPEPDDDPVTTFELLWREYDAYYSHFIERGIDWDSVYEIYRPRVTPDMGAVPLADLLGEMVVGLEDGHADLVTGSTTYRYTGWYEPYPENYVPEAIPAYVRRGPSGGAASGAVQAPGLAYGWLTDRIGYVRIPGFGNASVRDGIDVALEALAGTEALVLDIRHNGGGSDLNSDAVIGRFLERRLLAQYHAYRNGPAHDDFTEPIARYIEPASEAPYRGLLAVLTNRRVFSTAEAFVLATDALGRRRYTVLVGDTTGGGFGNPLWRELPNGWKFRVPRWKVWSADIVQYEGVGIPPDIPVRITAADEAALRDPILEAAIDALEGQGLGL